MSIGATQARAMPAQTPDARFLEKVLFPEDNDPEACWEWTAYRDADGYGIFYANGKKVRAHRFSYESELGPIPDGLTIDHLCGNEPCVNSWHMEPVTFGENTLRGNGFSGVNARKVRCVNGHALTDENVYVPPSKPTRRLCRECRRNRVREQHQRRRGVSPLPHDEVE